MYGVAQDRLQDLVEHLEWQGARVSTAADAVREGDESLTERYGAMLSALVGAELLLERRRHNGSPLRVFEGQTLPPGSLGALVQRRLATDPRPATGRSEAVSELRLVAHELRLITTALFAPDRNPVHEWFATAFAAAQVPTLESSLGLWALLARVAFVDPECVLPVYDAVARGWLCGKASLPFTTVEWNVLWPRTPEEARETLCLKGPPLPSAHQWRTFLAGLRERGTLPAGLAPLLWKLVGDGVDPSSITPTVAAFGATFDDRLKEACARAVLLFPGQDRVARAPWLPRLAIETLRPFPPGTLGHDYFHLIVDNGFDPEVLDPDSVTGFHPGLDATNRRILQTHEVWHLVAGYSTSPLHETALSAFQLAQFGHNYSAMFLATALLTVVLTAPELTAPALQVIAEGWVHGRATRPLMLIDWNPLWGTPVNRIRRQYGIEPFRSEIPDLFAPAS